MDTLHYYMHWRGQIGILCLAENRVGLNLDRVLQPLGVLSGIPKGNEWHGTLARRYIDPQEGSKTVNVGKELT